jgi:hypothetical protein
MTISWPPSAGARHGCRSDSWSRTGRTSAVPTPDWSSSGRRSTAGLTISSLRRSSFRRSERKRCWRSNGVALTRASQWAGSPPAQSVDHRSGRSRGKSPKHSSRAPVRGSRVSPGPTFTPSRQSEKIPAASCVLSRIPTSARSSPQWPIWSRRVIALVGPYWWAASSHFRDLVPRPRPLLVSGVVDGTAWLVGWHPAGASRRGFPPRAYSEILVSEARRLRPEEV